MSERYWSDERKLYTDGCFEALWGRWQNDTKKCLGIHWLETDESYPCPKLYGGELGWFVIPPFLVMSILKDLLACVVTNPSHGSADVILAAMRECAEQTSK